MAKKWFGREDLEIVRNTEELAKLNRHRKEMILFSNYKARFLLYLPTREILSLVTISDYRRVTHEDIWSFWANYFGKPSELLDKYCLRFQFETETNTKGEYISNDCAIPGFAISEIYTCGFRDRTPESVRNELTASDLENIASYILSLENEMKLIQKEFNLDE